MADKYCLLCYYRNTRINNKYHNDMFNIIRFNYDSYDNHVIARKLHDYSKLNPDGDNPILRYGIALEHLEGLHPSDNQMKKLDHS